MTTILLLLGTGCAPTYTDQYTAMEAVCQWDDYTAEIDAEAPWAVWYPTMDYAAFPSEECVDHLLADLGTDVDAFIAADGVDVYQGVNETGRSYQYTRLGGLLAGLRVMLIRDYGDVEDHSDGVFVSTPYIEVLQEVSRDTDLQAVRAAHYNFVTSLVLETTPPTEAGEVSFNARYERATGTMRWGSVPEDPAGALSTLLHEPIHRDETKAHIACSHSSGYNPDLEGTRKCDQTRAGAYGFALAGLEVVRSGACQPGEFRAAAWKDLRMVNSLNTTDGLSADWKEAWDQTFPESYECGR